MMTCHKKDGLRKHSLSHQIIVAELMMSGQGQRDSGCQDEYHPETRLGPRQPMGNWDLYRHQFLRALSCRMEQGRLQGCQVFQTVQGTRWPHQSAWKCVSVTLKDGDSALRISLISHRCELPGALTHQRVITHQPFRRC